MDHKPFDMHLTKEKLFTRPIVVKIAEIVVYLTLGIPLLRGVYGAVSRVQEFVSEREFVFALDLRVAGLSGPVPSQAPTKNLSGFHGSAWGVVCAQAIPESTRIINIGFCITREM